ncbi:MAG: threonylcarbamoyl-AMP synthase [Christensenellaceae bacterium]|nr:threonylcarbamoyl-AMP synthase [Christensenellaceae bacterium]
MKTEIFDLKTEYDEGLETAAKAIADGKLVGFPTETVYGLGADAMNEEAVRSIYLAKGRPSNNPLIVHIYQFEQLDELVSEVPEKAEKLLRVFWPGPFTAVLNKKPEINDTVSGGLKTVAVRMPAHAMARELIKRSGKLIAAPSANLSGKPSPTTAQHVIDDFMGKIPVILDGGSADVGLESTVCDLRGDVPIVLRPGGVTAEMIRSVAGDVMISPGVLEELKEGEKALSPGMLYKHYSPKAEVFLAMGGEEKELAGRINILYDRCIKEGRKSEIFCMEASRSLYGERNCRLLGKNAEEIAASLFSELRLADERGVEVVLFEGLSTDGIGLAVMNRMIRAAGFKLI